MMMDTPPPAPAVSVTGFADTAQAEIASARAEIESLKSDRDFGKLLLHKVGYGEVAPDGVLQAKQRWNDLHKKAFPPPRE
jgi:hypothetical protein